MATVTCIAPVNIAVIKYWGKKDEKLIIPLNDSLSGTLSMEQMHAKTTIVASPDFKEDRIWLNGKEESISNPRLQNCLREIKRRAVTEGKSGDILKWHVHICSKNNFPTAAGLASSAAGYACLVYTLSQLYNISGDVSGIARQGSGSACRSLDGGFVRWQAGSKADGSDSVAVQVVPASHWPEMHVIILVVSDQEKKVSSTSGMQQSVETSELLKHRAANCVPQHVEDIEKAIKCKDFEKFAEITMKESNQFHAVALDTYPPAVYMNDVSHTIANLVHLYNKASGCIKVAYTFDAGPNACLYILESEVPKMMGVITHFLPGPNACDNYVQGIPVLQINTKDITSSIKKLGMEVQEPGLLQYIIHTQIGEGPEKLTEENCHLLDMAGMPLTQ